MTLPNFTHAAWIAPILSGLAASTFMLGIVQIDPTLAAAAIVTVLGALTAACVTIINAMAASRDRHDSAVERRALLEKAISSGMKTDVLVGKADTIIEKATEIHTLTNSNLSTVTASLAVANEKIEGLEKLVAQMLNSIKASADQAKATGAATEKRALEQHT